MRQWGQLQRRCYRAENVFLILNDMGETKKHCPSNTQFPTFRVRRGTEANVLIRIIGTKRLTAEKKLVGPRDPFEKGR